jgi:hypothetical protein
MKYIEKEKSNMSTKKLFVLLGTLIVAAALVSACAGAEGPAGPQGPAGPAGPQGPQGPAGESAMATDLTCTECHNDTNLISGKVSSWEASVHGSGPAYAYAGGREQCSACHSGDGFSDRIASHTMTADYNVSDPNPTRIDCRACHQIHTTYTKDDFALTTVEPVKLEALDATFDGGLGNLCANCHQQRTPFPEATDGMVSVTSTHWGGHHGPEAALLLGVGAAGVEGKPAAHYTLVENTCITCHMGGVSEDASHSFAPNPATCTECHADATSLDVNGVQTEIADKLEQVKAALQAKGLMDDTGTVVVGDYPEAQAAALWNYLFVEEDKSEGVHNPAFANAMLDAALEALK